MEMLFLGIGILLIFLMSMGFGYFVANKDKKENETRFSFLTHFPFEIKCRDEKLNLVFRGLLVIIAVLIGFTALYTLFINASYLLEKNLSLLILLNAFILVALFIIDTRKYKVHLITSILFMVVNLGIYFLIWYLPIRDNFVNYHLATLIIGVVLFLVLVFLTFLPSLKRWYVMEIDEEGNKTRGKVFPLALIEWIHIVIYLLSFIVLLINYLI